MPDYLISISDQKPVIDTAGLRDSDWTEEEISALRVCEFDGLFAVLWNRSESEESAALPDVTSEKIQTAAGAVAVARGMLPASWPLDVDEQDLRWRIVASKSVILELLQYAAGSGDLVFRQSINAPQVKAGELDASKADAHIDGGEPACKEAASASDSLRSALDAFLGDGDGPARFVTSYVEDETRRAFAVLIDRSRAEIAMETISNWMSDQEPSGKEAQVFGPLPPYLFAAPHLERLFGRQATPEVRASA